MSWLIPTRTEALPFVRRFADRHRPGYWREYHRANYGKRRAYLTAKAREYRARAA